MGIYLVKIFANYSKYNNLPFFAVYFGLLTAFLLLAIAPLISILIVAGLLIFYWLERRDDKIGHEQFIKDEKERKRRTNEHKLKLKSDYSYAKEVFFRDFCHIVNKQKDYAKEGVIFIEKYKEQIIIPTVWEKSFQKWGPAYRNLGKLTDVTECFDNNGNFLARQKYFDIEITAPTSEDGVPQTDLIHKREEILTLKSGERVEIIQESWHTAEGFNDGNLYIHRDIDFDTAKIVTEGMKDGKHTSLNESGQKSSEGIYKNGKLVRNTLYTYHKNGQKKFKVNYKDGEYHGKWTVWYENGQTKSESNYKNGKVDGKNTDWYKNGQIEREINYKDGKYHGKWTNWDEDGQTKSESNYKDGELID